MSRTDARSAVPDLNDPRLRAWLAERLTSPADHSTWLGSGYQGDVFLYEASDPPLVIKVASGRGVARAGRQRMLRHERRAYRRLEGLDGLPRCFGMIDKRHLVLEFVEGTPYREAEIADREAFFAELLQILRQMHERGVAHSDLKKKDNLLVVQDRPCLIDLGAAVIRSSGFAPINHYLFRLARAFDLNAWVKLKYRNDLSNLSAADRPLYNRTRAERFARWLKDRYQRFNAK